MPDLLVPAGTVVTRRNMVDWQQMRKQLDLVNQYAMGDLLAIYRTAQAMDPWAGRDYMEDAMRVLVKTYGGTAEDLSIAWFDEIVGDDMFFAQAPPPVAHEQLTKEVAWGTSPARSDDVLKRMSVLMQKHVFGRHRDTVDYNALRSNYGYTRDARPDACAFCRVLASRGAVYGSPSAAMYVGVAASRAHYSDGRRRGRRWKSGRKTARGPKLPGEKYHDNCRCLTAPLTPKVSTENPDTSGLFEEQYEEAMKILTKQGVMSPSMNDVTRMMREMGYGA